MPSSNKELHSVPHRKYFFVLVVVIVFLHSQNTKFTSLDDITHRPKIPNYVFPFMFLNIPKTAITYLLVSFKCLKTTHLSRWHNEYCQQKGFKREWRIFAVGPGFDGVQCEDEVKFWNGSPRDLTQSSFWDTTSREVSEPFYWDEELGAVSHVFSRLPSGMGTGSLISVRPEDSNCSLNCTPHGRVQLFPSSSALLASKKHS